MVQTYGHRRGKPLEVLWSGGCVVAQRADRGPCTNSARSQPARSRSKGSKAVLHINGPDGTPRDLTVDHVIAATGYRFNVGSLLFLGQRLISQLCCVQRAPCCRPALSPDPGLYFTGIASAYNFGPVMRFLCGTHYAARRISGDIAREQRRSPSSVSVGLVSVRNRTAC